MKTILSKIYNLRLKRGISRGKMASELHVTTGTYTKIEKGVYPVGVARLYEIAAILGVKCDALLDNDNPEVEYIQEQLGKAQDKLRHFNQIIIAEQGKLIQLHENHR